MLKRRFKLRFNKVTKMAQWKKKFKLKKISEKALLMRRLKQKFNKVKEMVFLKRKLEQKKVTLRVKKTKCNQRNEYNLITHKIRMI